MSEEFDGQDIGAYVAVIPGIKLESPDSYVRGTRLTLQMEVRVRSVQYNEITSGKSKGDLQKVHVLAIEDVDILNVMTPQQYIEMAERAALQAAAEADADIVDAEVVEATNALEAAPEASGQAAFVDATPEQVLEDDEIAPGDMWTDEDVAAVGAAVPEREVESIGF